MAAFTTLTAAVLALSNCTADTEDAASAGQQEEAQEVEQPEAEQPEEAQEDDQPDETQEQDEPQEPTGDSIGTLTIDGNAFELTGSDWCVEDGEVDGVHQEIFRVGAYNDDESVQIYALEVVTDDSDSGDYQQVEALAPVDDVWEFHSEHSLTGGYLEVDGHNVSIEDGDMTGYGHDGSRGSYEMAAHFSIGDEPTPC